MKNIRYRLEALLLRLLLLLFAALPPETASALGGWIGRSIGPRLAASRKAKRNLAAALPSLSAAEQNRVIAGMWNNLGRVVAEYPHLETLSRDFTTVENADILTGLIEKNTPAVFIGGHLGNWEINCTAMLTQFHQPIALTYRAPNNPQVARMLDLARTLNGRLQAFPKSAQSGRHILQTLKNGEFLGILIDQKYNEGVETPFFGRPAMTNPAFAQLCRKYECPLIPVRCERLSGCRFRLTVHPPLRVFDESGGALPTEDVIAQAHALLEEWIAEKPEQWLWLHRRWKDDPPTPP